MYIMLLHVYVWITQYGSIVYLGMTRVVLGQFQHFENTWCGAIAKHSHEEQKEYYSLTKRKLGYTLIPTMHTFSAQEMQTKFRSFPYS